MSTMGTVGVTRVGVVGYSAQVFDTHLAETALRDAFDVITTHGGATGYVVVSGLTDLGIPALAYREALARGWSTEGVASAKATEYDCYPVDNTIIVGTDWGDESETFLSRCDVLVRVGGGGQAHRETAAFRAAGGTVYEYELPAVEA